MAMSLGDEHMRQRANIVAHLFLIVWTLVLSCGRVKISRVVTFWASQNVLCIWLYDSLENRFSWTKMNVWNV